MGEIKNTPHSSDVNTDDLRRAFEHRATWFYYLLDEAKKRGANPEEIGRAAIKRCGFMHGERMIEICKEPDNMCEFVENFAPAPTKKVFEMDIVKNDKDSLYIDFHYCPLVCAWQKLGCTNNEIELLCDIAMDGDRGIAEKLGGYEFNLDAAIAKGDPVCKIRFDRKK